MKCSYCQKAIYRNLTIKEVLLPTPKITEELCASCRNLFVSLPKKGVCRGCQKSCSTEYCRDCQTWRKLYPDYDFQHEALFHYDEAFKEWMMQYKIAGDYRLRSTFAKEIKAYFRPFIHEGYLICPLPLSEQRFQDRGFNQAEALLTAAGVPVTQLLKRTGHTKPQAEKNRAGRMKLEQPFELNDATLKLNGQKIILADDVYTTGRTIFHAAAVVRASKAKKIRTFSLAR